MEITTLLDLLTEPELGNGQDWLVREIDEIGPVVSQLDEVIAWTEMRMEQPRIQHVLTRPIHCWWNDDMTCAVIVAQEHIERDGGDPQCALLMHKRFAYSLGQ